MSNRAARSIGDTGQTREKQKERWRDSNLVPTERNRGEEEGPQIRGKLVRVPDMGIQQNLSQGSDSSKEARVVSWVVKGSCKTRGLSRKTSEGAERERNDHTK